MKNLGWYEIDENEEIIKGNKRKAYELCIKERAWRMTDEYHDLESLTKAVENICNERNPGAYIKGLGAYYAREALENPGQPFD